MTANAAAGKSSVLKEQKEFAAAAAVGLRRLPLRIASKGGAADSGVVASAEDAWVVAAGSTLVAGFAVEAAKAVVQVGVACASMEVFAVEVTAAAGFATDGVGEDYVQRVGSVAWLGAAAGPRRPGSYRLDCCTAAPWEGLVGLAVSQASFAIPRQRAVSGWRCRSTVRSVERAGEVDGKLVIRVNAVHGNASGANVGSRVAAAVGAAVAAVAFRGEHSR